MHLDLNCDLGEGEPLEKTQALMRCITSANIACGGHAGNEQSIRACVQLALQNRVHIGAHPGLPGNFGRLEQEMDVPEFRLLLQNQVGMFLKILQEFGAKLHHLKLHGALYHLSERSRALRQTLFALIRDEFGACIIYGLAGGKLAAEGRAAGLEVWEEAFLDRNYHADGSLVPRTNPQALLSDPAQVRARFEQLLETGTIRTVEGNCLPVSPQTVCIHSDSPNALELAAMARSLSLKTAAG